MERWRLRGGAWPLPVSWRGEQARFEADLRDLPRFAATAALLGLSRTGTWVLPETPSDSPTAVAETVAFHLRRLGAIARILADFDCRLGLEIIGPASFRTGLGQPFVTRYADIEPLLGTLLATAPNVGLLLDAFHLHAARESLATVLDAWGSDRLVWVHVADLPAGAADDPAAIQDAERGLPGEHGAVNVAGFLQELADRGYEGPVTVEPLAGCRSLASLAVETVAQRAAGSLRAHWPPATPFSAGELS